MILPFTALSLSEAGHQEFELVNEQKICLEANVTGKTGLMATIVRRPQACGEAAADHFRSYRSPMANDRFSENPPFKSSARGWCALAVPMAMVARDAVIVDSIPAPSVIGFSDHFS